MPGNVNQRKPTEWTADAVLREQGIDPRTASGADVVQAMKTAEERNIGEALRQAGGVHDLPRIEMPPPDERHAVTDEGIREAMTYLAGMLDAAIQAATAQNGKRLGFALYIFEYQGDAMFYVSNGERAEVAPAIRKWLERVERT